LCVQNGRHVFYKAKGITKMKKLFATYAKSNHADPQSLRFVHNGTRISDDDTPSMVRTRTPSLRAFDVIDQLMSTV